MLQARSFPARLLQPALTGWDSSPAPWASRAGVFLRSQVCLLCNLHRVQRGNSGRLSWLKKEVQTPGVVWPPRV